MAIGAVLAVMVVAVMVVAVIVVVVMVMSAAAVAAEMVVDTGGDGIVVAFQQRFWCVIYKQVLELPKIL